MKKDSKCLVVDVSYMPRSIITTERAFVIYYKGNAEIVAEHDTYFKTVSTKRGEQGWPKPSIIRVPRRIDMDYKKTPLRRENVYKRDNYTCVYCEKRFSRNNLTWDHVVPTSKGGEHRWDNLVTCCYNCNQEKADLTIEEWGREDPKPRRPHHLMLMKTLTYVPPEWKPYLFY